MASNGVFFDLYGTLLIYGDMSAAWADWLSALHGSLVDCGLTMSQESLALQCDGFFEKPEPPSDIPGLTVYERRLRAFCAGLGLDANVRDIQTAAAVTIEAWEAYVSLDPEARPVLQALRPRKALALISNHDHPPHVHALLSKLGLAAFFDAIIVSGDVGVKKPDLRIFAPVLQQTGLRPDEAVFVGDAPEDVEGALAAGLSPVLIRREGVSQTKMASDFRSDQPHSQAAPGKPAADGVRVIRRLLELVEMLA